MTFLSPQKEKSLDPLKIKAFLLAEKEGFEPSRRSTRPTPLAGEPLRPLGYFSRSELIGPSQENGGESGIRTHGPFGSLVFKTSSLNRSDISPFETGRRLDALIILSHEIGIVNPKKGKV